MRKRPRLTAQEAIRKLNTLVRCKAPDGPLPVGSCGIVRGADRIDDDYGWCFTIEWPLIDRTEYEFADGDLYNEDEFFAMLEELAPEDPHA